MKGGVFALILFAIIIGTLSAPTQVSNQRQKRVSDQRLAELETLLALAQMKNRKYMSLPVGFGLIDVQKIGRRKRSVMSPISQFLFPREMSEISLRTGAVPLKAGDSLLRTEEIPPYVSPVIVDSLQGWERREPNLALLQEGENYL